MGERNRGQVLIVFVLALFVLVGFVALGIDVGYMYSIKNDLQRSADAGALAGASVFIDGIWDNTDLSKPAMMKADTRAKEYATQDFVGATKLTNADITISFPARDQIQVTTQRAANLFFGSIFGSGTRLIRAFATAMAEPVLWDLKCPNETGPPFRSPLAPLAVPYPFSDDGDGVYEPPGEQALNICIPANRSGTLCQGGRINLPVADTPDTGGGGYPGGIPGYIRDFAGEVFPVVICGDNPESENNLRDRISNPCSRSCNTLVSLGDPLTPKPNLTFNPAIEGMQILYDADSGATWNFGTNLPENSMYSDNNWLSSPRVMNVMLYDPSVAAGGGGIIVEGFAGFWIDTLPLPPPSVTNRTISGYLVPDSTSGKTDITPHFEPSLKTTRLVQ